jgi:hypothetical protein
MKSSEANDDMKTKLAAWRVEPDFHTDFNREVWRKIAASDAVRRESFWQSLASAFFVAPRPAAISTLALALLTLSLGTAHLAARSANSRHWTMLEERYAQSIDPLTRSAMRE